MGLVQCVGVGSLKVTRRSVNDRFGADNTCLVQRVWLRGFRILRDARLTPRGKNDVSLLFEGVGFRDRVPDAGGSSAPLTGRWHI